MKRLFAIALALFFMTATSGLVLADDMATAPAAKTIKHKKKHHKKAKKKAEKKDDSLAVPDSK